MIENSPENWFKLLKDARTWMLQSHSNTGIILASLSRRESMRQRAMDLEALLRFLIDFLKEDCRVPCTALKTGLKTRTSKSVSFKELSDMSASTESSTFSTSGATQSTGQISQRLSIPKVTLSLRETKPKETLKGSERSLSAQVTLRNKSTSTLPKNQNNKEQICRRLLWDFSSRTLISTSSQRL